MNVIVELLAIVGLFCLIERAYKAVRAKTVFVIDDDPVTLAVVQSKLKALGYKVKTFSSLNGVLIKIAAMRPDAVIVDYDLGGKLTGEHVYDFCIKHSIPSVIYTSTPEIVSKAKRVFGKTHVDPLDAISTFLKTV